MKTISYLLTILWSVCISVVAATATSKWSVGISEDFMSSYIGFDNGAVFYDKPMFQTDIFISHVSGFHSDIWWGTGLNSDLTGSGFDDEIDYNIGFGKTLPISGRKFEFDIGIGYWDIYNTAFRNFRNDIVHPYLEVGMPLEIVSGLGLTPFTKWQAYLLPFDTDFERGGESIVSIGCKYKLDLSKKVSFTGLTAINYDFGGFGFQPGLLWKEYSNIEWKINDHFLWKIVEMQFYVPMTVTDRDNEIVLGTGIKWSF